jgi:hypothetical protein
MNSVNYYEPLNLSDIFLTNINRLREQNDNETKLFNYKNKNITPTFRYYLDDTNLNLSSTFLPKFTYKNKQLFPREKPIQTEHDETSVNEAYLNKHFGYTDYGNFKVANQSLPERNKHKETPKNNIYNIL